MRYFRQATDAGATHLVAVDDDGAFDLTAATPDLDSFRSIARAAAVAEESVDALARRHLDDAPAVEVDSASTRRPVVPAEVWAAGVTYEISEQAREAESSMPDIYLDVYDAERPELFFKATPSRTVGPGEAVGVREDSDWNVPEPELGLVLYRGTVVGYTVGNDVSSRSIEGTNPLYLPQAKVFDRCCSLGPCVATAETVGDPTDLEMSMVVERDDAVCWEGRTSTAAMVRSHDELVAALARHNPLPDLTVLLTGTSLVPDEAFKLQAGDTVHIDVEGVGRLTNGVVTV